jgi:hypothetical protein
MHITLWYGIHSRFNDYKYTSNCYILNTYTSNCDKISQLTHSKSYPGLIYYVGCAYKFGGQSSGTRTAQRLHLKSRKCENLKEMIRDRFSSACVGMNTKVYIIRGNDVLDQIYDIERNEYEVVELRLRDMLCVAMSVDDCIRLVSGDETVILNRECEIIEEGKISEEKQFTRAHGSISYYQNKFFLLNFGPDW